MIGRIQEELDEKRLLTEQVNMLELIRLRSMYSRMVKEKGTALRKTQSQLDTMEMERRQSFKVFLPNSLRQANKFPQLEIIFNATRLMPETFPPVFKEWLKTIQEVKGKIDNAEAAYRGSADVEEDDALTAPDLISKVDVRLYEKAKESTEACDLSYYDDFKTFGRSTYPLWEYKDRIIAEWEERKLMPELMAAAQLNRKIYWRYL
ncbi:hypothetical protein BPAE_0082g00470 [Botrytis paeoniae]|uniref:Uncharacterized protein n=1 Tax=Botrytis paeoniae TaxID=278948 RepID=A0A4Z1FUJ2_9HELO|nr:hypothetical protein BPAE_0082g00470 [Botrytis paeoniae]